MARSAGWVWPAGNEEETGCVFLFFWFFIDEEKKNRGFGREKGRRNGWPARGRKKRRNQGVISEPTSPSRVARRLPRGLGVAAQPLL